MQVDKPTKNKLKYAPSHLIYGSKVLSYIASHKDFATIIRRPSDYVDPLTILKFGRFIVDNVQNFHTLSFK